MDELISVVITTYSRPHTLRRAIDSVISQTYKNLEIIIVDDNKNIEIRNEVRQIVREYKDNRIRLICNAKNMGGALSRNEGIKAAVGRFIAFLDDDDEYMPEKIRKQYEIFITSTDKKLALVYGYCKEVDKFGKESRVYTYDFTGNCLYEAMIDCIAATSQWMCKKSALIDVGMFSDVPCKQDSTVIVKLLIAGFTVDRVPDVLSIYHTDQKLRISDGNHKKRIEGEEKLRELCRTNYGTIAKKQQKEVEYSFATRLVEHYFACNRTKEFLESICCVLQKPLRYKSLVCYKHLLYLVLEKCCYLISRRRIQRM